MLGWLKKLLPRSLKSGVRRIAREIVGPTENSLDEYYIRLLEARLAEMEKMLERHQDETRKLLAEHGINAPKQAARTDKP